MRFVLHGGVCLNISDRVRIIPHALYMQQGTAREEMIGTYAQLTVNEETNFIIVAI